MDKTTVGKIGGWALIALGVLLYAVFGLAKGSPTDVGVYSISIIPLVLGIGLLWRSSQPATHER